MPPRQSNVPFPCPASRNWLDLAAGLLDSRQAEALMIHASECEQCSAELREAIAALKDSAGEEEQAPSAVNLDVPEISRRLARRSAQRRWLRIAAAAACCAAAVFAWWQLRGSAEPPLVLLAQSYSNQRTMQLRIPGARHSAWNSTRTGVAPSSDPTLADAEADIRRNVNPNSADWLHAKGRLEILQGRWESAVRTLETAEKTGANSADFRIDFATALFLHSRAAGSDEGIGRALESLDAALRQRAGDPAALFNRALMLAELGRTAEAAASLQQCLASEADPAWREEARRLRDSLPPPERR